MLELHVVKGLRELSKMLKREAKESLWQAEQLSINDKDNLCKANLLTGKAQALQYSAEKIDTYIRDNLIS
jgi:hypothetical protein